MKYKTLIILFSTILYTQSVYAQPSAGRLFQSGLYAEEITGDLEKALNIYERIINEYPDNRIVAAKALLQMGSSYEKLGRKEAKDIYRRLIVEFKDQGDFVREAQQRLERLEPAMSETTPEAREAYILAKHYRNMRGGRRKSLEYFEQAIKIDPNFALAYVGLARWYVFGGSSGMTREEAMLKAEKIANKALEIDNKLGEAHAVLGMKRMYNDWNWNGAENEFKRAIELNKDDVNAHEQYALLLASMGRMDESIKEMKKALSIDPVNRWANLSLGRMYFYNRDFDLAIEQYRKTIELTPDRSVPHLFLGLAFEQKGMYEEAMKSMRKYLTILRDTTLSDILGKTFINSGYPDVKRKWAESWEPYTEGGGVQAGSIALIYASIDEKDKAIEWLQKGYKKRTRNMLFIGVDPQFDSIRSDERFIKIMKNMGLAK